MSDLVPKKVLNWIGGQECEPAGGNYFANLSPHDGRELCQVARSSAEDVQKAVEAARAAQPIWAATPAVKRGEVLFDIAQRMQAKQKEIASLVALETGKSFKDALGETGAAIAQAFFMAGEGSRMFGRTTVSGVANRQPMVVREPVGVCALIVAANTPIANVAWKTFPALISGNAAILKASEDTPLTAWFFSQIIHQSALPPGTLNVVQGYGREVGSALVENPKIPLISFTGSTAVGRYIAEKAGARLARTFLELGGKNPMVIWEDADLENAVKWAMLSSFSNAGQRCAASSRIIIHDKVYDQFKDLFVARAARLKVGPSDEDDFGPVINERQMTNMLAAVDTAVKGGAKVLTGGQRLTTEGRANGYYVPPTILENVDPKAPISQDELFGPITCLYRVKDFEEAIAVANGIEFGLTSCIHTRNYNRALEFSRRIEAGVAVINAGTHGSEPHMPFGGVKNSGTGGREPGPEALDVYTNLKVISHNIDPTNV